MFQFSWWEKSDIFMILYQRVLIVSICCPGPIMKPHSQATHPRLLVKEIMLGAFCSCGLAHCGRSLIEQQYHTMSGWMFLHVWQLCFLRPALHNIYLVSTKRVYWHLYFGSLLCISRATMIASTGPEVGCLTMWFVLCKLQSEARIWGLDSCAHIRSQSLCCWAKTWQAELGKEGLYNIVLYSEGWSWGSTLVLACAMGDSSTFKKSFFPVSTQIRLSKIRLQQIALQKLADCSNPCNMGYKSMVKKGTLILV